jgi:hypothetical protein
MAKWHRKQEKEYQRKALEYFDLRAKQIKQGAERPPLLKRVKFYLSDKALDLASVLLAALALLLPSGADKKVEVTPQNGQTQNQPRQTQNEPIGLPPKDKIAWLPRREEGEGPEPPQEFDGGKVAPPGLSLASRKILLHARMYIHNDLGLDKYINELLKIK